MIRDSDYRVTEKMQEDIMKLDWAIKRQTKFSMGKLEMEQ